MRFTEARLGPYRIYAGALEAPGASGYTAALVVCRDGAAGAPPTEAFRDDHLACGYCWPTAEEALLYAVKRGRALIRLRSSQLAC